MAKPNFTLNFIAPLLMSGAAVTAIAAAPIAAAESYAVAAGAPSITIPAQQGGNYDRRGSGCSADGTCGGGGPQGGGCTAAGVCGHGGPGGGGGCARGVGCFQWGQ